jgi:hypothetical protein
MCLAVSDILCSHPLLRDASLAPEVTACEAAIRARAGKLVAELASPAWWDPCSPERARRLAVELAVKLRLEADGLAT